MTSVNIQYAEVRARGWTKSARTLFSHLACKEVYHIIFICKACLFVYSYARLVCLFIHMQGSPHTLSLQYETGFICKCDSIKKRILLDM